MLLLLLALVGCTGDGDLPDPPLLALPDGVVVGDELALTVTAAPAGDWADADDPGVLLEVRLGENVRHVVIPGGVGPVAQAVSLGAWDGGELALRALEGTLPDDATLSLQVDPTAAGVPVLGTYDASWANDTALVTYVENGTWTWVFTDEDGGTGLLPTLLLASWGRPVDIEGLWDEASGLLQTTDHAWVPFEGPYEGTHPLFEVVTYNGLIGPLTAASEGGAPYLLSPMPLPFDTDGGAVTREVVLDTARWVLATSWAEADREGLVVADGGQDGYPIGAPDDYLFLDYDVTGASVSFEAEVDGAWWSSLNGLGTSGLTDATVGGRGRTCIELPPGAAAADITGVRIRSHGGAGTASARLFHYAPRDAFVPEDLRDTPPVGFADGETALLP